MIMNYSAIYGYLFAFADYTVYGMLLCRMLAVVVSLAILWQSRLVASFLVKALAIGVFMILYWFPNIVGLFRIWPSR